MATQFKTPGVYVQELDAFPPSVAEVATAIPAFIGYTEMATNIANGDLLNVPTRITSLLEYEQFFGGEPPYNNLTVLLNVDSNNNYTPILSGIDTASTPAYHSSSVTKTPSGSETPSFYLYDSLRLFFDNGGGACYIVSIGDYTTALTDIEAEDFIGDVDGTGLATLTKYNEPSLLLFPDAVNLAPADLASLQQAALMQCSRIGNRFSILDMCRIPKIQDDFGSGENIDTPLTGSIDTFRNNIGMNNLKYGAVYSPYLKTTFSKKYKLYDIDNGLRILSSSGLTAVHLTDLVGTSSPLYGQLNEYLLLTHPATGTADNSLLATSMALLANVAFSNNHTANPPSTAAHVQGYFTSTTTGQKGLYKIIESIDALVDAAGSGHIRSTTFYNSAYNYVSTIVQPLLQEIVDLDYNLAATGTPVTGYVNRWGTTSEDLNLPSGALSATPPSPSTSPFTSISDAITVFQRLSARLAVAQQTLVNMGTGLADNMETTLTGQIPGYKNIVNMLNSIATTIPPSGAMAGIYAATDNIRGVWKAPANVSVNSVAGVDTFIDSAMQENMNIDTVAGKSVNAIRPFFGEGIMVWGARTLAGNDNNWRYVPVRRFISFAEESCKRSTSWAVFEPNDANLWMKVRSEIENFLYTQWRAGALAGAKPSDAYYVKCGLGTTMTAQDILNGYLNVLIGLAVVRPAEFIILEFTQILQVS
jgi:uncharacterized protein